MSLASSVAIRSVSLALLLLLQGCVASGPRGDGGAGGGGGPDGSAGDAGPGDAGADADGGVPDAGPSDGGADPRGYIFFGEYRADAGDVSGVRVCDYPALTHCTSDADGKSRGRMRDGPTGLSATAPVHVLKLWFRSTGYLARNPGAHAAIGLRGRITRDPAGDPIAVNGRGLIFGDLSAHPTNAGNAACGARILQVESYFGDDTLTNPALPANRIFPETCSDSILEEGQWYRLELFVSRDRRIGYRVLDAQAHLVHALVWQDPTDRIDLGLTDVFFGHVFDTRVATAAGTWALTLWDIQLSESDATVEALVGGPVMGFQRGQTRLADNALVTLDDLARVGVSVGDFAPSRRRLFGCADQAARVDDGLACADRADYRVIDFAADPSFLFDGTRLHLFAPAFEPFPPQTYRLVLRANPLSSLVQATLRIEKP